MEAQEEGKGWRKNSSTRDCISIVYKWVQISQIL